MCTSRITASQKTSLGHRCPFLGHGEALGRDRRSHPTCHISWLSFGNLSWGGQATWKAQWELSGASRVSFDLIGEPCPFLLSSLPRDNRTFGGQPATSKYLYYQVTGSQDPSLHAQKPCQLNKIFWVRYTKQGSLPTNKTRFFAM